MMDHTSDEYRASVTQALTGASDELVFNGTLDHAKVVIEEAFKAAKSHIRILANKLDDAAYGCAEVTGAAAAFLSKPDTSLDVLVEEPCALTSNKFVDKISTIGGTRVRVLSVPSEVMQTYKFNFLTVDDTAYRFEEDRSKRIAVVAGGPSAKHTAAQLAAVFDRLFALSGPLPLTLQAS